MASSSAAWRPGRGLCSCSATSCSNDAAGGLSRQTPLSSVRVLARRADSTSWRSTLGPSAAVAAQAGERLGHDRSAEHLVEQGLRCSTDSGLALQALEAAVLDEAVERRRSADRPASCSTAKTALDCTREVTGAWESSSSWSASSTSSTRRWSPANSQGGGPPGNRTPCLGRGRGCRQVRRCREQVRQRSEGDRPKI